MYPQPITETVFDVVPQANEIKGNFLERLWAYLTIKDLLERVARGDMTSCTQKETKVKREVMEDDEDYFYDEGSGHGQETDVEDIMDMMGDMDIVICDNLEKALYLSLKYEFVTPLTSLVVVKPNAKRENGDFGEVGAPENIRIIRSHANDISFQTTLLFLSMFIVSLNLLL